MNRQLVTLKIGLTFLMIAFFIIGSPFAESGNKEKNVEHLFELRYEAWKEYMSKHGFYSDSTVFVSCDEYKQIMNLGISVLPYMMKKIEDKADIDARWLIYAIERITKKRFHKEELVDVKTIGARGLWLRWWKKGRKQIPQRFEKLYSEWKDLKASGKEKEATEKYQKIRDLSIVALPFIMKKIEKGDTDLISAVSELTDGAIRKRAGASECLGWWENNKNKWVIPGQTTR